MDDVVVDDDEEAEAPTMPTANTSARADGIDRIMMHQRIRLTISKGSRFYEWGDDESLLSARAAGMYGMVP